jgi:Arc/MetJ-type ribon-helix-helix transcriptional regulator
MYYMVIRLVSSQLNVRTSPTLIEELDMLVNRGIFRNRTEAVNEGIRLLIRRYKAMRIAEKIDKIALGKKGRESLTKVLSEIRKDEDI